MSGVCVDALDHIVLCVREVTTTIEFYERVLGMEAPEERPGFSVYFRDPDAKLVELGNAITRI